MANVSGLGTTYNTTNFVGELFGLVPAETPFLSMSGGLNGGRNVTSKVFTWQTVDNAAAEQPAIVEGGDPTYEHRDRAEVNNVVQIFQYGVDLSYTKLAAVGQVDAAASPILGNQPVQNELDFQLQLKIERAARDVDYSFLRGAFQNPPDNNTGRKTRGILAAITSNTVAGGSADLSRDMLQELLRDMAGDGDSGAPFRRPTIFANAYQIQRISDIYGFAPESRVVGGVAIKTILADFTELSVVFERHMPTDQLLVADMAYVKPAFLAIPGRGHFFVEPKPASGANVRAQLYGEIGLEYGPQAWHGKITGLADGT